MILSIPNMHMIWRLTRRHMFLSLRRSSESRSFSGLTLTCTKSCGAALQETQAYMILSKKGLQGTHVFLSPLEGNYAPKYSLQNRHTCLLFKEGAEGEKHAQTLFCKAPNTQGST
jgi:hypothetical protein